MANYQGQKRRKFLDEYKAEAVRLIRNSGKSVTQMALELVIGETALRRWIAQAEVEAGRGPEGGADPQRAHGFGGVAPGEAARADGA